MTIADRLQKAIENKGTTPYRMEKEIGISRALIGKYLKDTEPSVNNILLLSQHLDVSLDWLIANRGSMQNNDENTTPVFVEEKTKGAIPYYEDLPISAGEAGLAEVSHEEKPTGYLMIPNVSAEQLFPVIGCSMLPRIKPGDIVGVNKLNRWDRVDPDKIYMIVTHEERMLKRLRRDNERDDILWCVSDNYQEFKIYKSEIVSIYHVVYHGQLL